MNTLILGVSNTGKTHFGGQLYGRLKGGEKFYRLRSTPDDIGIFKNIWENLEKGISGEHTPTGQNINLILPLIDENGNTLDVVYPDYAGEQLSNIVLGRKINSTWTEQIVSSNQWVLFLRIKSIEKITDITTRFYDYFDSKKESTHIFEGITDTSPVFYIELLQMFLYAKGIGLSSKQKPQLTILLSCWDEINCTDVPSDVLKDEMPLFYSFLQSNWARNFKVFGLSSTERPLSPTEPDEEFLYNGPESYGYIIDEDGKRNDDLTVVLNTKSSC